MPGKIAGYVSYEGNQSIVEDFYKENRLNANWRIWSFCYR